MAYRDTGRITLTQRRNELILDSTDVVALDIYYTGNIQGELQGNNNILGVNLSRILVVFMGGVQEPFLTYSGGFSIIKAISYDKNNNKDACIVNVISDRIEGLKTEWDSSDSKYEDLNEGSAYTGIRDTKLTYTANGVKYITNNKNKIISRSDNADNR